MFKPFAGGASTPFAHLARAVAGTGKPRVAEEEDEKTKKGKAASDEDQNDDESAAEDEEEDDESEDDKDKKSKKAKGKKVKGKKADPEDGDGDDEDEDEPEAAEDEGEEDDEDDDEDKKSKRSKKARAQERARIRAIVTSEAAKANPEAALNLALNTGMKASAAIALLQSFTPASSDRRSLRQRMASEPNPDVGVDGPGEMPKDDSKAKAQAIINAGKKARGEA